MSQVSVADAKNHLPHLVQEAERGLPVRITRRGVRVAVLISELEYERLTNSLPPLADFLSAWRVEMDCRKIPYIDDGGGQDWNDLRDDSQRPPVDFA